MMLRSKGGNKPKNRSRKNLHLRAIKLVLLRKEKMPFFVCGDPTHKLPDCNQKDKPKSEWWITKQKKNFAQLDANSDNGANGGNSDNARPCQEVNSRVCRAGKESTIVQRGM